MARIAFIMDRVFRKFGLSGKSFIPMLIGSGCGVPGVMASRTIENERDRRMTVMTTCFVPCGAKMPIIGLFAGALFGGSGLVAVSAYFIGVAAIIFSGIILKKTKAFAGDPAPFVMELPAYHVPSVGNVLRATWERGWSFIKRAGTIILASSIILWFLQGFGFTEAGFGMVEDNNTSLLAAIGGAVCFIFRPLGFGTWQATVATVTGLIAKENVVSTFGVLFGLGADLTEEDPGLLAAVGTHFTALSAYSFMIFNLLCAYGRHQAGNEQRQVDPGRHRLYVRLCLCGLPHRLPARRAYHRRGLLRHRHHRRRRRPRWLGLPPCPQKQVRREHPFHFRRRRRGQVRSAYECTNNYHWPDHFGRVCGHCGKGHLQPPPWQELLLLRGLLRRRVRPLRLVRAVPP